MRAKILKPTRVRPATCGSLTSEAGRWQVVRQNVEAALPRFTQLRRWVDLIAADAGLSRHRQQDRATIAATVRAARQRRRDRQTAVADAWMRIHRLETEGDYSRRAAAECGR